nr:PREDICTED: probable N-acetyltransferase CML6 [Apteryx mantelli mantelli]
MADYRIRAYRDEDYEAVREVFAAGMSEYVPSLCLHVLKQPWVVLLLACTFCLLLASSRSLLLPVLALTLLLAVGRQLLGSCWSAYIERCLADDLRDIRATYMQSARSRFWLRFAQARGYGAVVLYTSVVQTAAQRLYEGQGFRRVGAFSPSLLASLLHFQVLHYRCELPAAPPPAP